MILTKGAHQIAKSQTINCSDVVSLNLHFDRLLLLKVYKISSKRCVMQNVKKNRFVVSKMIRFWWILIRALKSLGKLHFDWSLLCKVCNVWPKKDILMTLKSYAKLNWCLENEMNNSENFHQSTWKSRNWDFDGILLSKIENAWTKSLQRSYV